MWNIYYFIKEVTVSSLEICLYVCIHIWCIYVLFNWTPSHKPSKLSASLQHYSLAANWSLTPPMEVLTFLHSTSSLLHNSVESFSVMSTPCALSHIELASFLLKYHPHQNLLYSYGTKTFCFANIFAYFT